MSKYEGSRADTGADLVGKKERRGARFENTVADRREDELRDYNSYVEAHRARKRGEPIRRPFNVSPNGPYFKNGQLNRDPHDPFGGPDQ